MRVSEQTLYNRRRKAERLAERRQAYRAGDRERTRVLSTITQAYQSGDYKRLLRELKLRTKWTDSCWVWTGWTGTDGRPRLGLAGAQVQPKRLMIEATQAAPLSHDSLVFVTCERLDCLNPEHLEVRHIKR